MFYVTLVTAKSIYSILIPFKISEILSAYNLKRLAIKA